MFQGSRRRAGPVHSRATGLVDIDEATARGLREKINARVQESEITLAQGERWEDLGDLLPTASARLGATRHVINLAAFGFSVPGFPTMVGPFTLHDSRPLVSQPLVDLHALYESRSSSAMLRAAELPLRDTRELVALAVRDLGGGRRKPPEGDRDSGANVHAYNPAARSLLAATRDALIKAGSDPATATTRAYAAVAGIVRRQATMVAFVGIFTTLGLTFLALVPLVFIMKRPRGKAAAPAH